ncbi:trypsin-like cysteine/serine peptidase domain-containing protein [Kickxella alabastrina]|uniref:trypsin-like cysteine/serine peptidase domain-containing protein n=1 Tax=Kickxella alabastrina TaxID=61397 RepID=UPI002220AA81|nr:trypsin-like cysteine/serine peptidase domain-containing protein [Kickxella alabastrina]KAI7821780.1 trypsin-like cysteine/serine peptidase domain-containing protein [Kickxella alabastrina]
MVKLSLFALASAAVIGSSSVNALDKRIVGGSTVSTSELFSFLTNIIVDNGSSTGVCTGALISSTIVLTSAACVADPISDQAVSAGRVLVGSGATSSAVGNGTVDATKAVAKGGYSQVSRITVHPGYNSIAFTDNIAVLELTQPLANATAAGIISKPVSTADTAYTAYGWGSTSADAGGSSKATAGPYTERLKQVNLAVGSKSACANVWAPYANLTNSLCLVPVKTSSNVCNGDGVLAKTAGDGSVGLAGLLNIIAVKGDVPAEVCNNVGAMDFFTTFGNYIGWLTQVTTLKENDFVSSAKFNYAAVSGADVQEEGDLDGEKSGAESASHAESSADASSKSSSSSASALVAATPLLALLVSGAASAFF